MSELNKTIVFLVDDDALYLKNIEIQFKQSNEFIIHTFPTGELCIENLALQPQFVVLDYHLNGIQATAMDGLKTLDKIKEISPNIDVIMLSSQDKIEVAVNCMHHHALDYVVKSDSAFLRLQKIISEKKQLDKVKKELKWYMDKM